MSTALLQKEKNVRELISEAVGPEKWVEHLKNDLMKFWDRPDAYEMQDGLFPTYRSNKGDKINPNNLPEELKAALADKDTAGLVETDNNFIRAHSRQTYAYGIAFHMTGIPKYLELCRKGALALVDAMDGNYGMFVKKSISTKEWDCDRMSRTSQDLAYGLTGLGMYYFLTHDAGIMHRIIQIKDYIFKTYMDDGKGYITWYPKHENEKDSQVQIVAQLDQLYAYMLMITPSLPEPYRTVWKKDMKKIADILITQFYSEHYEFFWGTEDTSESMSLGTDHTDFGHSVKTFWVILKIGELLGDPFYVDFARPKIDKILKEAYIEQTGSWARRFNEDGSLDTDKEWWILAELDQAAEILSMHDPWYYNYLNNTHRYWFDKMVDHEYGEIWHMVSGSDDTPMPNYPKVHNWKTSLHSFEHALFGYMTAARLKGQEIEVYYALPEWERVSHLTVAPYMFFGNITGIYKKGAVSFLPDGNSIYGITYNGLH
ncbi:MAG: hypothetical protein NC120_10305 [Ruminococcus sp.]|nr:hypothetical protein [Ruminococcus sp.]